MFNLETPIIKLKIILSKLKEIKENVALLAAKRYFYNPIPKIKLKQSPFKFLVEIEIYVCKLQRIELFLLKLNIFRNK